MTKATIKRAQVVYRGRFREPVFAALGNPAPLYASLLRHLKPFGAGIDSLSINVTVLAEANLSCYLPFGLIRIHLEYVELFIRDFGGEEHLRNVTKSLFAALSETGADLSPVRHEGTLMLWLTLDVPFSAYVQQFVSPPSGEHTLKPSLELREFTNEGTPLGATRMEETEGISEGLFVRTEVSLGDEPPDVDGLYKAFEKRFNQRFQMLGLEFSDGSGASA
jgi:hypothetical protein